MIKKIVSPFAILLLVVLPFLVGAVITPYTPYLETNAFATYVALWLVISVVLVSICFLVVKYVYPSLDSPLLCGLILFGLASPILGIVGLAGAPDLSLQMLEHPEREHLRYSFLFLAAILFGAFALIQLKSPVLQMEGTGRWILATFFLLCFAEFIWEFRHHYLYPEGLQDWIGHGKKAEDFGKNYDNFQVIILGVLGRYFQYLSILWVVFRLYRLQQISLWSPVLTVVWCLPGFVSATVVYITQFNLPKGYEFLMLFFIPGAPFIVLYWLGVALLTRFRKSKPAT